LRWYAIGLHQRCTIQGADRRIYLLTKQNFWFRQTKDALSREQTAALIARCKKLVLQVKIIVIDETRKWDHEFKDVLSKLDQAAQKKALSVSEKSSKQQ